MDSTGLRVLLLGVGLQGKAALHDLVGDSRVAEVVAADQDPAIDSYVAAKGYLEKVRCVSVDATDPASVARWLAGVDVVLDLLPAHLHEVPIRVAVDHGVPLVHSSYVTPEARSLAGEAEKKGVTILPELGMDPGIDLVLAGEAVRGLDTVDDLVSYGAGFPEPEAAKHPIRYKVTWRLEGVLKSYHRAARLVRDGTVVEIPAGEIFSPAHIHDVRLEGLGTLEAFPNGDALHYADVLGLDVSKLRRLERCVLRWPGHAKFWKAWADLGLLDDTPVSLDGVKLDKKRFLAAALEPQLRYQDEERDVVVVRVDVAGLRAGRRVRVVYELIDYRDPITGLSAMSRTVGFSASIGALLVGTGVITKKGLLSPVTDVPYAPFEKELARRGLRVRRWEE